MMVLGFVLFFNVSVAGWLVRVDTKPVMTQKFTEIEENGEITQIIIQNIWIKRKEVQRQNKNSHNQTNGIRPHHGLGLLRPQALPLYEEELQRHPKEGSPHLQVLGLLGESPGPRSPKR